MSSKYKFRDPDKLYFVSYSVVYWIDLFIRNEYKEVLLKSWEYCIEKKGMELYAWCIMTSHVHMIIGSNGQKLENIMRDMKRFTSEQLRSAILSHPCESRKEWILNMMVEAGKANNNNGGFQLWQQSNHPIELWKPETMNQKLQYIHNNPVVAGFVEKAEDYLYSSAKDYCGMKGLISINLLDPFLEKR